MGNYQEPPQESHDQPVIGDDPPQARVLFGNRAYDRVKFVAQILLPALAVFYGSLGGLWEFPKTEEVVGSLIALDLFLGALLSLSSAQYRNSPERFDGTMFVKRDVNALGEPVLKAGYSVDTPAEVLEGKTEATFKVQEAPDDLLGS